MTLTVLHFSFKSLKTGISSVAAHLATTTVAWVRRTTPKIIRLNTSPVYISVIPSNYTISTILAKTRLNIFNDRKVITLCVQVQKQTKPRPFTKVMKN